MLINYKIIMWYVALMVEFRVATIKLSNYQLPDTQEVKFQAPPATLHIWHVLINHKTIYPVYIDSGVQSHNNQVITNYSKHTY